MGTRGAELLLTAYCVSVVFKAPRASYVLEPYRGSAYQPPLKKPSSLSSLCLHDSHFLKQNPSNASTCVGLEIIIELQHAAA